MKCFVDDWKKLAITGYSMWGAYAFIFLTFAPDVIYLVSEIDVTPWVVSVLQIIAAVFTVFGRLIVQKFETRWRRRIIIIGALVAIITMAWPALAHEKPKPDFDDVAFTLISGWEGENKKLANYKGITAIWNVSYLDTIAKPPRWTVCFGHTRTAGPGQYKTDEVCKKLLLKEIAEYRDGLYVYFTAQTKRERLTVMRADAFVSLAYNIGIRSAGKSTATRRLNKGDIIGACKAIAWWTRAGGRVVRGLVRRRSQEREYCLRGL